MFDMQVRRLLPYPWDHLVNPAVEAGIRSATRPDQLARLVSGRDGNVTSPRQPPPGHRGTRRLLSCVVCDTLLPGLYWPASISTWSTFGSCVLGNFLYFLRSPSGKTSLSRALSLNQHCIMLP